MVTLHAISLCAGLIFANLASAAQETKLESGKSQSADWEVVDLRPDIVLTNDHPGRVNQSRPECIKRHNHLKILAEWMVKNDRRPTTDDGFLAPSLSRRPLDQTVPVTTAALDTDANDILQWVEDMGLGDEAIKSYAKQPFLCDRRTNRCGLAPSKFDAKWANPKRLSNALPKHDEKHGYYCHGCWTKKLNDDKEERKAAFCNALFTDFARNQFRNLGKEPVYNDEVEKQKFASLCKEHKLRPQDAAKAITETHQSLLSPDSPSRSF